MTSHILAEVEDSQNGEYPWGTNMLTIGDCHRQIQLEFFLGKAKNRKQSIAKIDFFIEVLTEFRKALIEEANLIQKAKGK